MFIDNLYNKFLSLSRWVRLSLIASLLQIFFICTLEALVLMGALHDLDQMNTLVLIIKNSPSIQNKISSEFPVESLEQSQLKFQALPVYFGLFFFAQIFQFVLCCDAAKSQNTIQILVLALFNFLLLLYAFVQVFQTVSGHSFFERLAASAELPFEYSKFISPLEITIIVILLIFAISFAIIACKLYREYGWNIYKRIGADLQMRKRFTIYHVFVMVLKFDILLFVSFSTQYICLVIIPNAGFELDFYVHLSASILICLVMSILAFWSVKTESHIGIILFALGSLGVMTYFGYKLVLILLPCSPQDCPKDRFASSRIFLSLFTCFCILFALFTILGSILCYGNFGKGLKHIINDTPSHTSSHDDRNKQKTNRWSLD